MSAKIHGSYSVRIAVALALGTVAVIASAPQVRAADADTSVNKPASSDDTKLEEVTVTGSRIRRKDLTSASPLITIDSEQLEQRAGLNLESYLNQLPNFNPAQTPTTENSDVQPSAVNTVGISTISLRGFGPNRSRPGIHKVQPALQVRQCAPRIVAENERNGAHPPPR